jgi:hypothetical protein
MDNSKYQGDKWSTTDLAFTAGELWAAMYLTDSRRLKLDDKGLLNPVLGIGGFFLFKWIEQKIRSSYPATQAPAITVTTTQTIPIQTEAPAPQVNPAAPVLQTPPTTVDETTQTAGSMFRNFQG